MSHLPPIGTKHITTMHANFRLIPNLTLGGDWAMKENGLAQTIIPLMPDASDRMHRVAIRLIEAHDIYRSFFALNPGRDRL